MKVLKSFCFSFLTHITNLPLLHVNIIGLTKPVSGLFGVFRLSLEYYKKNQNEITEKKIMSPTYCLHYA